MSSVAAPARRTRKQPAKPARVLRLYPEPERPAAAHARRLLAMIAEFSDRRGSWVIVGDLQRVYGELAAKEGLTELRWSTIGRELGKLTRRKTVKLHGQRHVAYLLR